MTAALWIVAGFACGALPFSVWLSRRLAGADARRFGDGNSGAANAWRAGGCRVGVAALLLDSLKGALPVAAAHFGAGLSGWALVLAALAPILGHAFSPLLGFRGGKGLTVTFGVWSGLLLAQAPLVLGLGMVLFYVLLRGDAWVVVFIAPPLLLALSLLGLGLPAALPLTATGLALGLWALTIARLRLPPALLVVYPLSVALAAVIALHSLVTTVTGKAAWKGRQLAARR